MFIAIPIPDLSAFSETIVIDNVPYRISMHWNHRGAFWVMNIADRNNVPLISGIKLVQFYELTAQYKARNIPQGKFTVLDTSNNTSLNRIEKEDFINTRQLQLLYVSEDDLNAL